MRAGLYVRVSTQEQAKEGYSIGEQTERLTNYCKAKGWEIYKVYTDGGYSGKDTHRPSMERLVKDVESGVLDMVLVYKLDRLSRSQKDTLFLIEDVFNANGVAFSSMTENFDTSTPFGRAVIGILSTFAQLEREQIKERITIGLEARAKDGKWTGGGNPPIGYNFVNDSLLEIDDYEAMQVREAFELFLQRLPISRIVTILNEKGYTHQYGTWKVHSLKEVLRRPVYCGLVRYKGKISEGIHDPIISMETFEKAQEIFDERDKDNPDYKNSFKYKYALGGLLHCRQCNAYYGKKKSHCLADGTPVHKYMCYSYSKPSGHQIKKADCDNKRWFADQLENIIYGEVHKLAFDPGYVEKQLKDNFSDNENAMLVTTFEKRIEEIDQAMSRYSDLYALGTYTIEDIKAKVTPLSKEKEKLKRQIDIIRAEGNKMAPEQARDLAESFGEALENGDLDEQRFILQELIQKIELDGEDVHIYWNFV